MFSDHEKITPAVVKVAHERSFVVGKGTVLVDIGAIKNIITYDKLNYNVERFCCASIIQDFRMWITSTHIIGKDLMVFKHGSLDDNDILKVAEWDNALHPLIMRSSPQNLLCSVAEVDSYNNWHERRSYLQRPIHPTAWATRGCTYLAKQIIENLECVPCLFANMKRASIKPSVAIYQYYRLCI